MLLRSIFARALGVSALLLAGGCSRPYDVELSMPNLALDTTNPAFPVLAALPKNPKANTFRLAWSVTPNATRPMESLAHFVIYNRTVNRTAKTLAIHRDRATYELYSNVSDASISKVAAQKGAASDLLRQGSSASSFPEK